MSFAYVFDFDGVLVNTMEMHFACYGKALEEVGVPIDRNRFFSQAGMTGKEQIRYFCQQAGRNLDVDSIYERKKEIAREYGSQAEPIECNLQLLRMLKNMGISVAIATGSSRPSILPVMQHFRIDVDAIVSAEDVTRGKPHPDLFLCAAEKLGIRPENVIVVEDSDVGVEAAKAAGMKVLRFYDNRK